MQNTIEILRSDFQQNSSILRPLVAWKKYKIRKYKLMLSIYIHNNLSYFMLYIISNIHKIFVKILYIPKQPLFKHLISQIFISTLFQLCKPTFKFVILCNILIAIMLVYELDKFIPNNCCTLRNKVQF